MSSLKSALEKALKESGVEISRREESSSTFDGISIPPFRRMPQPLRRTPQPLLSVGQTVIVQSPFYDLLKGALEFDLVFPVDENGEGPHCDEVGTPISKGPGEQKVVRIQAVPLGSNRFRLAKNPIFESLTELKWGDEFQVVKDSSGQIKLDRVVLPKKFHHEFSLISGSVTRGSKLSNRIHELDGGWETIAGGMLIVTLPVDNWSKFTEWTVPKQNSSD